MSEMSLDALRQNLTNPQRVYLWEFEIPAPKGSGDTDVWILRTQMMQEPGRRFDPIDIPFKGTGGFRVPGKEVYTHEITVRVLEGEDAKAFEAIQSWMELIRSNISGLGSADPDLKSDAIVRLLDSKGETTKAIKLVGMYPQEKPTVDLDYSTNDSQKYDVTFSFDRWETITV